jgi:hypothetical protein
VPSIIFKVFALGGEILHPKHKENFTTEFRNFEDDAWYIVMLTIKKDTTLRARLKKTTDDVDQLFEP